MTVADDLPEMLVGDAVRLRAALENLIDNAVKFTAQRLGTARVARRRAGRGRVKLAFTVSDSGIGLTPAEIKRLFRPFAQANADIARRYGGAGLGLAVVKVLAKLMGGDLSVTSTPGRGSRFVFRRCCRCAADRCAEERRERRPAAPARALAVLCVEDNPYGRVILNTILTELGHRADFAGSGEEAVAAVTRGYDAVLMDMTLPGDRRAGGDTPNSRARGRSGQTADHRHFRAHRSRATRAPRDAAGMNVYLRKPISPSALSEALAAVVPAAPAAHDPEK